MKLLGGQSAWVLINSFGKSCGKNVWRKPMTKKSSNTVDEFGKMRHSSICGHVKVVQLGGSLVSRQMLQTLRRNFKTRIAKISKLNTKEIKLKNSL